MVCAGKDGVVRELESGTVSCEIKTELGKITQLISSKSDRLMLVGTQDGTLRAYEQPLDASQENVDCSLIHRYNGGLELTPPRGLQRWGSN